MKFLDKPKYNKISLKSCYSVRHMIESVTERLISFSSSSCQQPNNIHFFYSQNKKSNTSANKKIVLEVPLQLKNK